MTCRTTSRLRRDAERVLRVVRPKRRPQLRAGNKADAARAPRVAPLRFDPDFDRINGVPAVFLVVAKRADQENARPNAGDRQRNGWADFADRERTTSVR